MNGRKRYSRPQAMLWANNAGTTVEDEETGEIYHIPLGHEVNSAAHLEDNEYEFLILSDDNRKEIDFSIERIETRERMVSGRMRSYHIADKVSIKTSWDMLPSRAFSSYADFDYSGSPDLVESVEVDTNSGTVIKSVKPYGSAYYNDQQYTTDGGAGGVDMLDWYERYTGSFWLYLSYDKNTNFKNMETQDQYANLNKYNQVIEVFFDDFSYNVVKRGGTNYDFWNISIGLEEV
jgi:hypothetical protein